MWGCIFLVLGSVVVGGLSALNTETLRPRPTFDINYRQVDSGKVEIPLPVSSPNSPPADSLTTHAVVPPPTPSPPTVVFSFISSSIPATQPILSSPTASPITTSPPSPSQISITALPPLPSSDLPNTVTLPKQHSEANQKFKLIYLAPVFALLGILWGGLTAWFAYGCVTRRPKVVRKVNTIGGPRYLPAESDEADGQRDVEGGRLMREIQKAEAFRWPSIHARPEVPRREPEDDPFLVPPPMHQGRPSKSTRSTRTAVSAYSDVNSMYDPESEERRKEEEVPWENLRHKSIKRGILEQVKKEGSWIDSLRGITGSSFSRSAREAEVNTNAIGSGSGAGAGSTRRVSRRMRHTRADSDLHIQQDINLKSPDRVTLKAQHSNYSSGYSTQPSTRNNSTRTTPVRGYSSQTVHSQDVGLDGTQWVSGGGFRIVEESPLPTPKEPEVSRSKFGSGWWWGSGGADVDRYTPVPPRSDRSQSRSNSPVKGTRDMNKNQETQHSHAGVLPQSPAQIMSPPLESQLCFTPSPPSNARMTASTSSAAKRRKDDNKTTPTKSSGKKKATKLVSPRVPLLPFPDRGINSPRPDVYRPRLVKPSVKARPPAAATATAMAESSTPTSTLEAGYDHDADITSDALKRVEEIIGQSWSTRDLSEEGVRSLSPTGFGKRL